MHATYTYVTDGSECVLCPAPDGRSPQGEAIIAIVHMISMVYTAVNGLTAWPLINRGTLRRRLGQLNHTAHCHDLSMGNVILNVPQSC